ncbi:putative protein OS=Streptomyces griseomycini OX=66895 GN=FHS37_005300 PE=4 SV=1 [Streptomyces griseomycini]|uniref:Uncharacterized protein n=1 Tax=Streptomyces griseomycini TaxID=66895 RepID=A0A7W7V8I9_9ACTN|nr:hypothetical protein [Streptomyces griseomycini]
MGAEARILRSPGPSRGTRIASLTAANRVQSLVFSPVTAKTSGQP